MAAMRGHLDGVVVLLGNLVVLRLAAVPTERAAAQGHPAWLSHTLPWPSATQLPPGSATRGQVHYACPQGRTAFRAAPWSSLQS